MFKKKLCLFLIPKKNKVLDSEGTYMYIYIYIIYIHIDTHRYIDKTREREGDLYSFIHLIVFSFIYSFID